MAWQFSTRGETEDWENAFLSLERFSLDQLWLDGYRYVSLHLPPPELLRKKPKAFINFLLKVWIGSISIVSACANIKKSWYIVFTFRCWVFFGSVWIWSSDNVCAGDNAPTGKIGKVTVWEGGWRAGGGAGSWRGLLSGARPWNLTCLLVQNLFASKL